MDKKTKLKIFKIIMLIVAIAICIGITVYLFPFMKNLATPEGQIAFKERVNSSGIYGLLLLFAIQVAQIFLFVLPGEPIEILAGMCYGGFGGTILVMVSIAISAGLIYLMVRVFEKKNK